MKIEQQIEKIERVKQELKKCKPHSKRYAELQVRLRDMTTKLLRSEIRIVRRKAA